MKPGDTCVDSSGAYGYDDIEAKDAENRRNKQLILSVIAGLVIIGAAGFAVREFASNVRAAAQVRASANDKWLRPDDPGRLESRELARVA
ncbi:hypothetical protein ACFWP3_36280 [Streptomyces sp. NPDC058525]|uniref:hypothetical protein n=1 Tax=Streptomyces sp. NPDC058525 TaxID=3346538 RepID=UPI00364E7CFB